MAEGLGDRDDCGVPGSLPVKEAAKVVQEALGFRVVTRGV